MAASSDTPQPGEELSQPPTEKRKKKDKKSCLTALRSGRKFLKEIYGAQRVSCDGKVEVFLSSYRQATQKKVPPRNKKKNKKYLPLRYKRLSKTWLKKTMGLTWIGDPSLSA